jgi:hypothetical protein
MQIKKSYGKSVFTQFVMTYTALVIIVTTSIGALVNFYVVNGYKKEIERNQLGVLEQYAHLIERDLILRIQEIYSEIMNPSRNEVRLSDIIFSGELDSTAVCKLYNELCEIAAHTPYVNGISVYDYEKEILISSVYGLKFLDRLDQHTNYYASWVDGIKTFSELEATLGIIRYNHSGSDYQCFTFVRSYPSYLPLNQSKGAVAIEINEGYISNMFKQLLDHEDSQLMLINQNQEVFASSTNNTLGQNLIQLGLPPLSLDKNKEGGMVFDTQESYHIAYSSLMLWGWRVIKMTPISTFYAITNQMHYALFLICVLTIFTGIGIALFFSVRMYNPFKALSQVLRNNLPFTGHGNEFKQIDHVIKTLNKSISALKLRVDNNLSLLKSNLVLSLINNIITDRQTFIRQATNAEVTITPSTCYCVMLLQVNPSFMSKLDHRNIQLVKMHLTNHLEGLYIPNVQLINTKVMNLELC